MNPEPMGPVAAAERLEFLDVLRGVALLGIVTANMFLYALWGLVPMAVQESLPTYRLDGALSFLELWLVEGKFYTLFALMFGVGFSILSGRARDKGLAFQRFFMRRASFLFLIGAAHAVLIWPDDILETYSVCGTLLLPFVSARPRTLLILAVAALLAALPLHATGGIPVGWLAEARQSCYQHFGFSRETALQAYAQGGVAEVVQLNACHWFGQVRYVLGSGMLFKVYGCFLLGFLFGREQWHRQLAQRRELIRRVALWGLAIGLPLNLQLAFVFETDTWIEVLACTFGVLPLSLGYAALLCLAWLRADGPRRLRPFSYVGRMALSNYLGQSLICTLIFNGPGLGLAGSVGPTLYFLIGFGVYALEVAWSRWWLERFSYGPVEWLWRMATYGQRIRLARPLAAMEQPA